MGYTPHFSRAYAKAKKEILDAKCACVCVCVLANYLD